MCFSKAAEQDHPASMCNLGVCYLRGRGVSRDAKIAVRWFAKAAELGHAESQFNLAEAYFHGNGVTQSDAKAAEW